MIDMVSTHRYQKVAPLRHSLSQGQTAAGQQAVGLGQDGPWLVERQGDDWRPVASRRELQSLIQSGPPSQWAERLALWQDRGPWWQLFRPDGKVQSQELQPIRSLWSRSQWINLPGPAPVGSQQAPTWQLMARVVPAQIQVEQEALVLPRVVTDLKSPYGVQYCSMAGENWTPPHNPLATLSA